MHTLDLSGHCKQGQSWLKNWQAITGFTIKEFRPYCFNLFSITVEILPPVHGHRLSDLINLCRVQFLQLIRRKMGSAPWQGCCITHPMEESNFFPDRICSFGYYRRGLVLCFFSWISISIWQGHLPFQSFH